MLVYFIDHLVIICKSYFYWVKGQQINMQYVNLHLFCKGCEYHGNCTHWGKSNWFIEYKRIHTLYKWAEYGLMYICT